MKLIPFDISRALAGDPIQTREGKEVKFIAYVPEANVGSQVLFLRKKTVLGARLNGWRAENYESDDDLFMVPKKVERWLNIYQSPSGITVGSFPHPSHEAADNLAKESASIHHNRIACIKIEFTEGEGL